MRSKKGCYVDGCNNSVDHPGAGVCNACYQFMYYWRGSTPTERMGRIRQLEQWQRRAEQLLLPKEVARIKKRRA